MNLYKAEFVHYAPKDWEKGISYYFIATNDEEAYNTVYEYEPYCIESEKISKEDFINSRGEIYADIEVNLSDSYYGIKIKGWSLVKESISKDDIDKLIKLDIIEVSNKD